MNIKINNTATNTQGVNAGITWNPQFIATVSNMFDGSKLQSYIDSTILESMTPYMPFDTGMLVASGKLNTTIGSGLLVWKTPYARYLYYGILYVDPVTGSSYARKGVTKVPAVPTKPLKYQKLQPKSGPFWCENWKHDNLIPFEKNLQQKAGELLRR